MNFIPLFAFILLLFALILGQIHLSKMENKNLGLILPLLVLIYSVFMVIFMADFSGTAKEVLENVLTTFIVSNVPNVLLLWIYSNCRKTIARSKKND